MFDYIRVSCCVPAIAVADVQGNGEKIKAQLKTAAEGQHAGSVSGAVPDRLYLSGSVFPEKLADGLRRGSR